MLTIQQIKDTVTDYFKDKPVRKVYLFGSYARGDAKEGSDIDILFSLTENTRINYFGLAQYLVDLETKLSNRVDLVEEELIYPRIKKVLMKIKSLYSQNNMGQERDNILYLELIDKAIEQIFEYIKDTDEEIFLRDNMKRDACLMQLITIGENGGKVSQELKEKFNDVEWQQMKAARNFFAHAYDYTDWRRVWDTINTVLPTLRPKIENIIEVLERENNAKTN